VIYFECENISIFQNSFIDHNTKKHGWLRVNTQIAICFRHISNI